MGNRRPGRLGAAVACALAGLLSVAGCVSIPNGGPVLSEPVTPGADALNQPYPQLIPRPPAPGGSPADIVRGFLTASASFADGQQVARDFLTPVSSRAWHPTWSATVFSGSDPRITRVTYPDPANRDQVSVTVSGNVQAELSASGAYAVPSASGGTTSSVTFTLTRKDKHAQWRISSAPPGQLLLTSTEFAADYQLRNLYFLDPQARFLVPDPVYVPLQTASVNLLNGLVRDLIRPPDDWLRDGTRTAFPPGTRLLADVVVNGSAAEVNIGGAVARAGDDVLGKVSAQLLSTLSGSGQGQPAIQSVVLDVDGKPWFPPQAQQNPVQHSTTLQVPSGASSYFYYLGGQGELMRRPVAGGPAVKVRTLGTGYSAIAVSPDGRYLAALRDGTLYTGPLGGPLFKRGGSGYTTMSWDARDRLWAVAAGAVAMLRGDVTARSAQALTAPESVLVTQPDGYPETEPVTAVRVAPDGVRVAFIIGGTARTLAFGAIARRVPGPAQEQVPPRAGQLAEGLPVIKLSPFHVSGSDEFSSVSWYGANNVVTMGVGTSTEGPRLTEYSVNGVSSTVIPTEMGIRSVTTSAGGELIAATEDGTLLGNLSTSGAWASIGSSGLAPAYPGLRTVVWPMLRFAANVPPDNSAEAS